jgi:predicted aldo/keto reductase-like oxidoreductase
MKYRHFGKLGWEVSALGFGVMRLPILGKDMSRVDEPLAIEMLRYAIDHGVNYLDSGYLYHNGNSEKVIGKALKDGYRQRVKMVTKLPAYLVQQASDFDRLFNEQLDRLQIDRLDIYLMHGLNLKTWTKIKELKVLDWVESKIAEGKIQHVGFSFHDSFENFKQIVDSYDNWVMTQILYNYMDVERQAGKKGLEYAASKGLAVVVMEPLRGGLLAKNPPAAVRKIWDQSPPSSRSRVEWALDWVWTHPEVSTALSGMSTMEQVRQNLEYAERSESSVLSHEEMLFIEKVRDAYNSLIPIPCSACRYCCPCPSGVEIPAVFEIYNESTVYEDSEIGNFRYNSQFGLKPEQRADRCSECRQCESQCPQQIQIVDWLKKAHAKLAAK